jgi:2-polyprenyl-3-methyl-5-hydroxy-6-metoxy-1,4-benzoquinol methylase
MKELNIKNKEYVTFLKSKAKTNDLISNLKISYRPYICPFNNILNQIGENKKIFDIGFGNGMLLAICDKYLNPQKLGGVEIDDDLIINAKQLLQSSPTEKDLLQFNGSDIPNKISTYDVVTLIDVLLHIPKDLHFTFLKQLLQKLSKNSILIIKDINRESPLVIFNKMHDLLLSREKTHERGFKELIRFFKQQSNCEIIYSKTQNVLVYPHYFLTIKKK